MKEYRSSFHPFVVYMAEHRFAAYVLNSFLFERLIKEDIQWMSLDHYYPEKLRNFILECRMDFLEKDHLPNEEIAL